jgi:hypothetical protein
MSKTTWAANKEDNNLKEDDTFKEKHAVERSGLHAVGAREKRARK